MDKPMSKCSFLATLVILSLATVSFGQVPQSRHVFIVVEENTNYVGSVGSSLMPYLNNLANQYGLATQYYADTHPSIGNYLMLTTGQILTNDDGQTPTTFPVSADNIVRELLAAGKTWKSYCEDLPSVGYIGGDSGNYAVRHCPLPYMTDVQNSTTQRQNLVPFTQFPADLASGTLPNYSFIAPNLCNDAHDCGIDVADSWLQTNIDPLIKSALFQKDGLLIILFDEADTDNSHGGGQVLWVVIGPQVKSSFKSGNFYQHENTLRMLCEALALTNCPGAAATAADMAEFFVPDITPPATTASASPTPNSNGWNNTDVYVTLTSTDNVGGTGVKNVQFVLTGAQTDDSTVEGSGTTIRITAHGTTNLMYFGTDNAGNVEPPKTLTVNIDKAPPVITGMPAPSCAIWPPNHTLTEIGTVTASDALSGVAPGSLIVAGNSNEPSRLSDRDIVIASNGSRGFTIQLRAERLGAGTGRVYTLNATATDLAGNIATSTAQCAVPHDQRAYVP